MAKLLALIASKEAAFESVTEMALMKRTAWPLSGHVISSAAHYDLLDRRLLCWPRLLSARDHA